MKLKVLLFTEQTEFPVEMCVGRVSAVQQYGIFQHFRLNLTLDCVVCPDVSVTHEKRRPFDMN